MLQWSAWFCVICLHSALSHWTCYGSALRAKITTHPAVFHFFTVFSINSQNTNYKLVNELTNSMFSTISSAESTVWQTGPWNIWSLQIACYRSICVINLMFCKLHFINQFCYRVQSMLQISKSKPKKWQYSDQFCYVIVTRSYLAYQKCLSKYPPKIPKRMLGS